MRKAFSATVMHAPEEGDARVGAHPSALRERTDHQRSLVSRVRPRAHAEYARAFWSVSSETSRYDTSAACADGGERARSHAALKPRGPCACVRARTRACVRVCVCARVRACACVCVR
eukprot:1408353-Pleurochrysis_carterae.AAC.1